MNYVVIYGSVRRERKGIRAARYIVRKLSERGHIATLIDPIEYPLPLLDLMYKEYTDQPAPPVLEQLAEHFRAADGFIVVSGEYNHTIPPPLSNLLDHFLEEYFFRPSAIVSYSGGSFGGVRAAMQLRVMLAEIGMSSIPSIFPIQTIEKSLDEVGNPLDEKLDKSIVKFLNEFDWYASALKEARTKGTPY